MAPYSENTAKYCTIIIQVETHIKSSLGPELCALLDDNHPLGGALHATILLVVHS
jgi:hypothetical protein